MSVDNSTIVFVVHSCCLRSVGLDQPTPTYLKNHENFVLLYPNMARLDF